MVYDISKRVSGATPPAEQTRKDSQSLSLSLSLSLCLSLSLPVTHLSFTHKHTYNVSDYVLCVCVKETFVRAQMWIKELEKFYIPGSNVLVLVGNKGDLSDVRQVSQQVKTTSVSCKQVTV